MRRQVIHHPLGVRPAKSLAIRAGLVRTFGSLAGFVVVTFFLIKPQRRSRTASPVRSLDSAHPATRPIVKPVARAAYQDNSRNNLTY